LKSIDYNVAMTFILNNKRDILQYFLAYVIQWSVDFSDAVL